MTKILCVFALLSGLLFSCVEPAIDNVSGEYQATWHFIGPGPMIGGSSNSLDTVFTRNIIVQHGSKPNTITIENLLNDIEILDSDGQTVFASGTSWIGSGYPQIDYSLKFFKDSCIVQKQSSGSGFGTVSYYINGSR